MKVFILQTQNQRILNNDLEWSSEADRNAIFHTPHRDIAINQLIELNAKDISLRASVVECEADSKGRPVLTVGQQASNANSTASDQFNAA